MSEFERNEVIITLIACTTIIFLVTIITWGATENNIEENKQAIENPLHHCANRCAVNSRTYESCLKECNDVLECKVD